MGEISTHQSNHAHPVKPTTGSGHAPSHYHDVPKSPRNPSLPHPLWCPTPPMSITRDRRTFPPSVAHSPSYYPVWRRASRCNGHARTLCHGNARSTTSMRTRVMGSGSSIQRRSLIVAILGNRRTTLGTFGAICHSASRCARLVMWVWVTWISVGGVNYSDLYTQKYIMPRHYCIPHSVAPYRRSIHSFDSLKHYIYSRLRVRANYRSSSGAPSMSLA